MATAVWDLAANPQQILPGGQCAQECAHPGWEKFPGRMHRKNGHLRRGPPRQQSHQITPCQCLIGVGGFEQADAMAAQYKGRRRLAVAAGDGTPYVNALALSGAHEIPFGLAVSRIEQYAV